MIIYISFVSFSLLFFAMSYSKSQCKEKENALGIKYKEPQPFLFALGCLALILLFAFRGRTGTDTPLYNRIFSGMKYKSLNDAYLTGRDWLFYILNWLTFRLSSGSIVFNNFIVGCIAYIPVLIIYKKYSSNFVLAVLFYIITSAYFFAYNGQRQGLAISIVFAGFPYLAKKRYLSYILLVLFASLFHSSTIIILPFSLMISMRTESKAFILFSISLILSAIFLWRLWETIFSVLNLLGREKIVNDYGTLTEEITAGTGVNILRVLVFMLPALLGIVFYRQLQEKNQYFYIILNYNIISALFMLAALHTWYIARLADYFCVAMPMLLIELTGIVKENSKRLFLSIMIILFLVYIWFSLHMESHLLPYYLTIDRFINSFF